jgi:hypothetical protein
MELKRKRKKRQSVFVPLGEYFNKNSSGFSCTKEKRNRIYINYAVFLILSEFLVPMILR